MGDGPDFRRDRLLTMTFDNHRKVSDIQDTTEIYALKLIPRQEALEMAITGQFADGKTVLGLLWMAHDPQFSSAVQSRSTPAT